MTASIVHYFFEWGELKSRFVRNLDDLAPTSDANNPVSGLVHLSFKPPLLSEINEDLSCFKNSLLCSASLFYADVGKDVSIDVEKTLMIGPIKAFPVQSFFNRSCDMEEIKNNNHLFENLIEVTDETNIKVQDEYLFDFSWSVRSQNVMKSNNIFYLQDLLKFTGDDLLNLPNFGRKSLKEIEDFLEHRSLSLSDSRKKKVTFIPHNPDDYRAIEEELGGLDNLNIIENFRQSLSKLPERERAIVKRRAGFFGEAETLEGIGRSENITKQRVGQIEQKAIDRILNTPTFNWNPINTFGLSLEDIFNKISQPLSIDFLAQLDERFKHNNSDRNIFVYILGKLLPVNIYSIEMGSQKYLARIHGDKLDEIIKQIKITLSSSERFSLSYIRQQSAGFFPADCSELSDAVIDYLLRHSLFYKKDGEQMLGKYFEKRTGETAAFDIITRAEKPLSTEEIISIAKLDYPELESRNIQNRLANLEGIFPFRHGVWGSLIHLQFSEDEITYIKELSVEFITSFSKDGKQFHSRQLLDYIELHDAELANKTDEFQVAGLLRSFDLCPYLGRSMFSSDSSVSSRMAIHDVIVGVLKENNKPMHSDQIIERANQFRSISSTYQIIAKSPIKLLGQRVFGLDFWDYSKFSDELLEELYQSNRHSDEVKEQALKMFEDGLTRDDISNELNVPAGTLSTWKSKAGLTLNRSKYSDEVKEQALKMFEDGLTGDEISNELNVPAATLRGWKRNAGLTLNQSKYSDEVKEQALEMWEGDLTVAQISEKLDIP